MEKNFAEAENLFEGLMKNAVETKVITEAPETDWDIIVKSGIFVFKKAELTMDDGLVLKISDIYNWGNRDGMVKFSKEEFEALGEKDPEEYLKRKGAYLADVYTSEDTWTYEGISENDGEYALCYSIDYQEYYCEE